MKAEDIKWCPQHGYPLPCTKCGMPLSQLQQKEISFKAGADEEAKQGIARCSMTYDDGKRAGINEVVEWVMSHQDGFMAGQDVQVVAGNECTYGNTSHLLVRWLEWQSKLEEWEIA